MKENKDIFLMIEFPNDRLKFEGPFGPYSAKKRMAFFVERQHLPVTLTHAATLAEAILVLTHGSNLRDRNNIGIASTKNTS